MFSQLDIFLFELSTPVVNLVQESNLSSSANEGMKKINVTNYERLICWKNNHNIARSPRAPKGPDFLNNRSFSELGTNGQK